MRFEIRGLLNQTLQRIKKHGWRVFPLGLKHLAVRIYRRERLLCFSLDPEPGNAFETRHKLRKLDSEIIAKAALQNAGDTATMEYLDRCQERVAGNGQPGYVLCSPENDFLSFAWVVPCDGYYVEDFAIRLEGKRVLILDCFTPLRHRRKNYYCTVLRLIVQLYRQEKEQLLIFCSDQNLASVKGILKAGFVQRSSFVSKVILGRFRSASAA